MSNTEEYEENRRRRRENITYCEIFSHIGKMLDMAENGDKWGLMGEQDVSMLLCRVKPNCLCYVKELCNTIHEKAFDRLVMDGII